MTLPIYDVLSFLVLDFFHVVSVALSPAKKRVTSKTHSWCQWYCIVWYGVLWYSMVLCSVV